MCGGAAAAAPGGRGEGGGDCTGEAPGEQPQGHLIHSPGTEQDWPWYITVIFTVLYMAGVRIIIIGCQTNK